MSKLAEPDTKILILDAAEQAFAKVGFAAASLRQITSAAGVNLAAVHYHFGSKEALIAAVFSRRIGPLNQERMELLDACEAAAGPGPLQLEPVIEGLIGPALRLARNPAKGGPIVMRLFGRVIAEPSADLQMMLGDQFGEVLKRFTAAFHRALPALSPPVVFWRVQFVIGAMGHIMCDPANVKRISKGLCDPRDTEQVIRQLVAFLAAGMRAPATGHEQSPPPSPSEPGLLEEPSQ